MALISTWAGLDAAERLARLRCMQIGARIIVGPQANGFIRALKAAEHDVALLSACDDELNRLPTTPMRRLLSTFIASL